MSKHACITKANTALAKAGKNTELVQVMDIVNSRWSLVIATRKANPKKVGKPALICATYCPFCGEKLHAEEGQSKRAIAPAS